MQLVKLALVAATLVCGLLSAFYWWKASLVQADTKGGHDSGSTQFQQGSWIAAVLDQSMQSARLSAIAARWSAATALFGALLAIFC